MKNYCWLLCLYFSAVVCASAQIIADARHLRCSPDGEKIVVSDFANHRFIVVDITTNEGIAVVDTLTGGRMAEWSADSARIGFKIVQEHRGVRKQAAAVYDVEKQRVSLLSSFDDQVGNPSFSDDGRIAFTVGKYLQVVDRSFAPLFAIELAHAANWVAISPEGERVLYNDSEGVIWLYHLPTQTQRSITPLQQQYFCPQWSRDGQQVLVSSLRGQTFIIDVATDTMMGIGDLVAPYWVEKNDIVGVRRTVIDDRVLLDIVRCDGRGRNEVLLSRADMFPISPTISAQRRQIFFHSQGQLYFGDLQGKALQVVDFEISRDVAAPRMEIADIADEPRKMRIVHGVPYIHQIWCTEFNKAVSCGATSAAMILAYFGKLSHWDSVAPSPFRHTSHYGNYVSKKYTWGKHVFDAWGAGSSVPTYGGHGYVWQVPVDTKTHLKEYIERHGVASAVDWSPTWTELQQKVAARQPFVILTSITSAGHYKTVVGYHEGQHTLVVNDPYGNKNEGYGKFNGAAVSYDWPGYNNGHQSLVQVHCFIYGNGTPPAISPGTTGNPIVIGSFPYSHSATTATSHGTDVFNLYNGSSANEKGREITYRFTVDKPGTLTASVQCDQQADIDLHLLTTLSADSCVIRAHESFTRAIQPGTYYLVCDTFVNSNGEELMGDYTVTCQFTADSSK